MKYKVGDEVIAKVRISEVYEKNNYPYEAVNVSHRNKARSIALRESDIIQKPDMTAEEAWEIAKKILLYPNQGGYNSGELEEIFGRTEHLWELTPQQAKTKIEAWEAEKGIEVGDEVALKDNPYKDDSKFFVTKLDKKENRISGVSGFDGGVFWGRNIMKYQKTGRHIDIDGLLKQIGGDE